MVVERSCGGGEGEGGEGDLDEVAGGLSGYLDEYRMSVLSIRGSVMAPCLKKADGTRSVL